MEQHFRARPTVNLPLQPNPSKQFFRIESQNHNSRTMPQPRWKRHPLGRREPNLPEVFPMGERRNEDIAHSGKSSKIKNSYLPIADLVFNRGG